VRGVGVADEAWHAAPVSLRVGPGAELAHVRASGFGVSDPGVGRASFVGLLLAAGIEWRMTGALALRVDAEAAAPLQRPRFTLAPRGVVWRPPPVSGRLVVGLAVGR
jgi:hypothetical protein